MATTRPPSSVTLPTALREALAGAPELAARFEALAPSHRREYAKYVSEAKQEATQRRRAAKALEMIAAKK
jgi:uncharacterized protein YdeI (YjbR/CyaY-like superfamily)